MRNKDVVNRIKNALKNKLFTQAICLLYNYRPKMEPLQYNYLYSSICSSLLFALFRQQREVILPYDYLLKLMSMPRGYDSVEPPKCLKCPYIVVDNNEINFEEYE